MSWDPKASKPMHWACEVLPPCPCRVTDCAARQDRPVTRGLQANPAPFPGRPYRRLLRGRAGTQVALRNRLPRQPASSAGRVHGCRLSNLGTVKVLSCPRRSTLSAADPCVRWASESRYLCERTLDHRRRDARRQTLRRDRRAPRSGACPRRPSAGSPPHPDPRDGDATPRIGNGSSHAYPGAGGSTALDTT